MKLTSKQQLQKPTVLFFFSLFFLFVFYGGKKIDWIHSVFVWHRVMFSKKSVVGKCWRFEIYMWLCSCVLKAGPCFSFARQCVPICLTIVCLRRNIWFISFFFFFSDEKACKERRRKTFSDYYYFIKIITSCDNGCKIEYNPVSDLVDSF